MPRKPAPQWATPLTLPETPLHRRPLIWMAMVGALLLVMGLSLSGPEQIDTPIAKAEGDADGSAAELGAAPAPEVIGEPPLGPPWRDFIVGHGDNLSLIFNRAGFTDTDLYRVARNNDRSLRQILSLIHI